MHIIPHQYAISYKSWPIGVHTPLGHGLCITYYVYVIDSTTSAFLTRAEISRRGSEVTITCEFANDYPEASCVLVYREYNDPYLTVEEYNRSTEFPVTISVDNPEKYTFVVFGKNGEEGKVPEPVILLNKSHTTFPQPETCEYVKQ